MSKFINIIQYEGDNSTFVWKHPCEDFNSLTQLIVHESQEAVFFMNGQALDLFGPGRYTLETQNIPMIGKLLTKPTKRKTPFHCEVYFINKATHMGMKWGTDSRVRFIDPATDIPLDIGASGEMNLQVMDSRKLLIKLVGTTNGLTNKDILSAEKDADGTVHRTLKSFFRAPLMAIVKSHLASVIKEQQLDVMEIDSHMMELSNALKGKIQCEFEEYGLAMPQFYITYISLPEDDYNYKRLKELRSKAYIDVKAEKVKTDIAVVSRERQLIEEQTKAQLAAIRAQSEADIQRAIGYAEADVMRAKGYTQKDLIEADVKKAYAEGIGKLGSNAGGSGSSGGGMFNDMLGAMAGMKMAGTVLEQMNFDAPKTTQPVNNMESTWTCSCGESGNTKKFCMNCGSPKPVNDDMIVCPKCGERIKKGKFCPECGAKLASHCFNCGASLPANAKFCPECGEKF